MIKSSPAGVYARLAQTAAIFIITSIVSLVLLSKAAPMVWEDHFQIGQNLRSTGALTVDNVPSIFRPPGFPAFVAASLLIGDAISAHGGGAAPRSTERDLRTVVCAQAIMLGVMAAALFGWAARRSGPAVAAGVAFAAALNPYSLGLAHVATYHLLFLVLASLSTLALFPLQESSRPLLRPAAIAGLLWGVTALAKPIALPIPFFVLPLLLARLPLRRAVTTCALLAAGMILVVGPYVARNYLVTGQTFVTAQGGIAIWGSTVEKVSPDQAFLAWQPIWWKAGMPIFTEVTGSPTFSDAIQNAYVLPLNAEFTRRAIGNIVDSPQIYLHNVLHNFVWFNLDTMSFWNKFLIAHNKRLVEVLSELWIVALMILAAAGVIWGCVKNDGDAMIVLAVYLCIVIAHAISFSTELYTISKFPPIVLGFALLLIRLENTPRGAVLARSTACGMAALALVISVLAA